jgi:hypothetical protein
MKTKQRGFLFISISYLNLLEPGSGLHREQMKATILATYMRDHHRTVEK